MSKAKKKIIKTLWNILFGKKKPSAPPGPRVEAAKRVAEDIPLKPKRSDIPTFKRWKDEDEWYRVWKEKGVRVTPKDLKMLRDLARRKGLDVDSKPKPKPKSKDKPKKPLALPGGKRLKGAKKVKVKTGAGKRKMDPKASVSERVRMRIEDQNRARSARAKQVKAIWKGAEWTGVGKHPKVKTTRITDGPKMSAEEAAAAKLEAEIAAKESLMRELQAKAQREKTKQIQLKKKKMGYEASSRERRLARQRKKGK